MISIGSEKALPTGGCGKVKPSRKGCLICGLLSGWCLSCTFFLSECTWWNCMRPSDRLLASSAVASIVEESTRACDLLGDIHEEVLVSVLLRPRVSSSMLPQEESSLACDLMVIPPMTAFGVVGEGAGAACPPGARQTSPRRKLCWSPSHKNSSNVQPLLTSYETVIWPFSCRRNCLALDESCGWSSRGTFVLFPSGVTTRTCEDDTS
mmetsp:Transcript_23411/g.53562  ORF Transcript_23411/g.53562 Transcript_23411/m.53562 type:complete len:208 (+) Transcript_23411:464-1087(+)